MKHHLFNRPLVNRNHGITNMTYQSGPRRVPGQLLNKPLEPGCGTSTQRPHADLREAIERIERAGELQRIQGADWKLEMGTLAEIVYRAGIAAGDPVRGHPGLSEGLPRHLRRDQLGEAPRHRARLPGAVASARRGARVSRPHEDAQADPAARGEGWAGSAKRHARTDIDVLKFPAPLAARARRRPLSRHRRPGDHARPGAKAGSTAAPTARWCRARTASACGSRPASTAGRSARSTGSRASPARCSSRCGHDPLLFLAGGNEIRFGLSEYDYAAGHRGAPYDVIESELYGLPMPAHAEIVLEGAMHPGETDARRPVRRIHRLLRRRPQRASRWCASSASTTATIRSSASPARWCRRPTSRTPSA